MILTSTDLLVYCDAGCSGNCGEDNWPQCRVEAGEAGPQVLATTVASCSQASMA